MTASLAIATAASEPAGGGRNGRGGRPPRGRRWDDDDESDHPLPEWHEDINAQWHDDWARR